MAIIQINEMANTFALFVSAGDCSTVRKRCPPTQEPLLLGQTVMEESFLVYASSTPPPMQSGF